MHLIYYYSVTTVADATPPVASLKRQQFASLRCTTSCSSDEGNVIEFTPLAPLARLDSLHEMVSDFILLINNIILYTYVRIGIGIGFYIV